MIYNVSFMPNIQSSRIIDNVTDYFKTPKRGKWKESLFWVKICNVCILTHVAYIWEDETVLFIYQWQYWGLISEILVSYNKTIPISTIERMNSFVWINDWSAVFQFQITFVQLPHLICQGTCFNAP